MWTKIVLKFNNLLYRPQTHSAYFKHSVDSRTINSHSINKWWTRQYSLMWLIYQIRSVAQSCPTLCDPMNRSTPGLPVHHQLPEFTETHVHRVSDAIQPSHPLSSPSPPAPNPSQHQIWRHYCLSYYNSLGNKILRVYFCHLFLMKKKMCSKPHHQCDSTEFASVVYAHS